VGSPNDIIAPCMLTLSAECGILEHEFTLKISIEGDALDQKVNVSLSNCSEIPVSS
jgi:hypothetical protein